MSRWKKCAMLVSALLTACVSSAYASESFRARPPQDEVIYFLLPDRFENGDVSNDRGSLHGDRLHTGFDPTSKGFFHGGDLKGVLARLDYIQALGATAIWLSPVFRNKPVQGPPGNESAGYHGYWVTDFTHVDPHLGADVDLRKLIDAAHARGMKVYLDIIVNHTADVIQYRECPTSSCPYRSRADYPYVRRGGINGEPINDGFAGDDPAHRTAENFAKLTRADFAYMPFVPADEEHIKVPAWLNDPIYYHNRGDSTFSGESSEMGDFVGLDDLMTENPRVVQGFIDIYGKWIDDFGVDGYRIDTARHVDPEFWQAFVPAIRARAAAHGIPNFHLFGEVSMSGADVALLARYSRAAHLPAVLDFAFANAVHATVAGNAGTDVLARMFADDELYEGGAATALQLPTFIDNHDMGRFAYFVRTAFPQADDDEWLRRVTLAYAMLFTLRGVPVIYYGDEQGFAGSGDDQAARQDMFATHVASYRDELRVGGRSTPATFDREHALYRSIAALASLRKSHPALLHGSQIVRNYSDKSGLFAVSRIDPVSSREIVVAFNTSTQALTAQVEVSTASGTFKSLYGTCTGKVSAPGSYQVRLAPLDFVVCEAERAQ
jgi:glycosidase